MFELKNKFNGKLTSSMDRFLGSVASIHTSSVVGCVWVSIRRPVAFRRNNVRKRWWWRWSRLWNSISANNVYWIFIGCARETIGSSIETKSNIYPVLAQYTSEFRNDGNNSSHRASNQRSIFCLSSSSGSNTSGWLWRACEGAISRALECVCVCVWETPSRCGQMQFLETIRTVIRFSIRYLVLCSAHLRCYGVLQHAVTLLLVANDFENTFKMMEHTRRAVKIAKQIEAKSNWNDISLMWATELKTLPLASCLPPSTFLQCVLCVWVCVDGSACATVSAISLKITNFPLAIFFECSSRHQGIWLSFPWINQKQFRSARPTPHTLWVCVFGVANYSQILYTLYLSVEYIFHSSEIDSVWRFLFHYF